MAITLTPTAPLAEMPIDQTNNGGGLLQVEAIDGVVTVEGTADHARDIWFTVGLTDYPTKNLGVTTSAPGGYYFALVGITHIRARLVSGNMATLTLNAKVY